MKNQTRHSKLIRVALLGGLLAGLLASPAAWAADTVTVGSGSGPAGSVVDVPVYIRDASGATLGIDQPVGSRIQSYSIRVTYAPASAVQSISFTRAGITQSLTPAFESSPSSPGAVALLDTFQESTNLIPFNLNAALPGDRVAHLLVTLSPTAVPGTIVTLTLDPALTELTDEAGNPGTVETVANTRLTLTNGAVTVAAPAAVIPTASPIILLVMAIGLAFIGSRFIRA